MSEYQWHKGSIVFENDKSYKITLPDGNFIWMVKYLVPEHTDDSILIKESTYQRALDELPPSDEITAILQNKNAFLVNFAPNFVRHLIVEAISQKGYVFVKLKSKYSVFIKVPLIDVQEWVKLLKKTTKNGSKY
jgi:hypothetical protein